MYDMRMEKYTMRMETRRGVFNTNLGSENMQCNKFSPNFTYGGKIIIQDSLFPQKMPIGQSAKIAHLQIFPSLQHDSYNTSFSRESASDRAWFRKTLLSAEQVLLCQPSILH